MTEALFVVVVLKAPSTLSTVIVSIKSYPKMWPQRCGKTTGQKVLWLSMAYRSVIGAKNNKSTKKENRCKTTKDNVGDVYDHEMYK